MRYYRVGDILNPEPADTELDSLVELIKEQVHQGSWNYGQSEITVFHSDLTLLIKENRYGHDQIACLLDSFRARD